MGRSTDTSSASKAVAVSPSDTVSFVGGACRAIWVGGAGTVVAIMADGTTGTFVGVPAGSVLPIQATRVNNTSTTATSMVALY